MKRVSIKDLGSVIHPSSSKLRVSVLLKAYFDGSFTHPDKEVRVTAIGGYIGTEEAWTEVEKMWAEQKANWGLEEFSYSTILAKRSRVGSVDAERCVLSFGRILNKSRLTGISAALRDDDWDAAPKDPQYLASFPRSYHTCLHMLFNVLSEHIRLTFPGEPIAVVIDTDIHPDAAMHAIRDAAQASNDQITAVTFARRNRFPLIEVADYCAGAQRNLFLAGGPFDPSVPFNRLHYCMAKEHRGSYWSIEEQRRIEEITRRMRGG